MYTESTIKQEFDKEGLIFVSDDIKTRHDISEISHEVDFVDIMTGDVFTFAVTKNNNIAYASNLESLEAWITNKAINVERQCNMAHHESDFFNDSDFYLYDNGLGSVYEAKAYKDKNGFWYFAKNGNISAGDVKCTSVKSTKLMT